MTPSAYDYPNIVQCRLLPSATPSTNSVGLARAETARGALEGAAPEYPKRNTLLLSVVLEYSVQVVSVIRIPSSPRAVLGLIVHHVFHLLLSFNTLLLSTIFTMAWGWGKSVLPPYVNLFIKHTHAACPCTLSAHITLIQLLSSHHEPPDVYFKLDRH